MQRIRLVASVLAIVSATVFSSSPLWAGIQPEPFRTGLFGVTEGQGIRISVFNDRVQEVCPIPDTVVASVVIRGLSGTPLLETHTRPIPDGTGAFVDFLPPPITNLPPPIPSLLGVSLNGARIPGGTELPGRRLQVRAEVVVLSVGPDGAPVPDDGAGDGELIPAVRACRDAVVATLEVFDRASRSTGFSMPFARVAFNPQPEPPEPIRRNQ